MAEYAALLYPFSKMSSPFLHVLQPEKTEGEENKYFFPFLPFIQPAFIRKRIIAFNIIEI